MRRKKESPFALAAFTIAAGLLISCSVIMMNELPHQVLHSKTIQAAYDEDLGKFQADNLRFSIQLPQKFDTLVGVQHVDLLTTAGKITISRTATDYDNLKDYLNELDSKRQSQIQNEQEMNIDGYQAVSRTEISSPDSENKVYDIMVDGWVYSLSSSQKPLFNDLAQIATSFTYLP